MPTLTAAPARQQHFAHYLIGRVQTRSRSDRILHHDLIVQCEVALAVTRTESLFSGYDVLGYSSEGHYAADQLRRAYAHLGYLATGYDEYSGLLLTTSDLIATITHVFGLPQQGA